MEAMSAPAGDADFTPESVLAMRRDIPEMGQRGKGGRGQCHAPPAQPQTRAGFAHS